MPSKHEKPSVEDTDKGKEDISVEVFKKNVLETGAALGGVLGTGYLMSKDDAYDATHLDTRIENIAGSLKSLVDDPNQDILIN